MDAEMSPKLYGGIRHRRFANVIQKNTTRPINRQYKLYKTLPQDLLLCNVALTHYENLGKYTQDDHVVLTLTQDNSLLTPAHHHYSETCLPH